MLPLKLTQPLPFHGTNMKDLKANTIKTPAPNERVAASGAVLR